MIYFLKPFKLLKSLFLLQLFIVLTALSPISNAQDGNSASKLAELIGEEAYEYLNQNQSFSSTEWNYLELVAQRVALFDILTQNGEYLAPWDDVYAKQNSLLNVLNEMAPLAQEAHDLEELISDQSSDTELISMAKEDLVRVEEALYIESQRLSEVLWDLASPSVSGDIIIEIFPSKDHPESPLVIGTMAQFYLNLAKSNGWSAEVLSMKENNKNPGMLIEGGQPLSHAYIKIKGPDVYRQLFLDSGTHRFIYTDDNKISGLDRNKSIHTSYADVRVFAKPKRSKFIFKHSDVTFQFTKSTGAGGQHVNTTDSAVRATHTPSGKTVLVQQERSQHANRAVALDTLEAILFTEHLEAQQRKLDQTRNRVDSNLVTNSPYVRTYNLHRNPVETKALLKGEVRPTSFNSWEEFLDLKLSDMIDLISSEIADLARKLPQEFSQSGLHQALSLEHSNTAGSCKIILNAN